jgi:hypothetical protein
MNGGEEKWYTLQNKTLFTLVILPLDDKDEIHFYEDIYKRDDELASLFIK